MGTFTGPVVCCQTATCGRHTLLERVTRFFIDQDYEGEHILLIYNNSAVEQKLGDFDLPDNKKIILVNNHIDKVTGSIYTTLGAIYRDMLDYIPEGVEICNFFDDDDIFLPNHISEGVKGFMRSDPNQKAYKPEKSYYRHPKGLELMGNNLEPSVFVTLGHLREYGYKDNTEDQHMSWFWPLLEKQEMFIDPLGVPSLVYNWGDTDIPTFKTSGNAGHINNFQNYRNFSQDHGDRMITPWTKEQVQKYYNLVYVNK